MHKEKQFPKVTIVITTLNDLENLKYCLKSLFNLDYPSDRCEIIVVDAGSKDGSINFVKSLESQTKFPIKLIVRDKCNRSEGRNIGILHASTELVTIVNSDAVLMSDWLKTVVEFITQHPEAGGVGSYQICPTGQGLLGKAVWYLPSMSINEYNFPDLKSKEFCESVVIPNEAAIYRKSALINIGLFDERFNIGEDSELNARLIENGWKLYILKSAKIEHMHKRTILRFFRQQFQYGYGAAILEDAIPRDRLRMWISPYKLTISKVGPLILLFSVTLLLNYLQYHTFVLLLLLVVATGSIAFALLNFERLNHAWKCDKRLALLIFMYFLIKIIANEVGYLYGLVKRVLCYRLKTLCKGLFAQ